MPIEINRKLTPLSQLDQWKNRQRRNFFMYLAVPLLIQFRSLMNDRFLFR
jgi:hypothetical protein